MNTIRIFLTESGRIADLKKDFPLYQGQFQNKLLNIYCPTSLMAPNFTLQSSDGTVLADYVASTSAKIGMTYTARDGSIKVSKNYYMRYLKTTTIQGVEYALYERKLPQEFTFYAGQGANAPILIINIVNIEQQTDNGTPSILSVITSQTCPLDVMPSTNLDQDESIEPSELENINAQINEINEILPKKQDKVDDGLNTTNKSVVGAINEVKATGDTNTTNITQNTEDIAKNTDDINTIKQIIGTGEDYIGTLTWENTVLPTNEELNAFVERTVSREPKSGDVVIVIQKLEGQTDKNYKYIYSPVNNWVYYEIPPMELASNGTAGLVSGTYGVGSTNNTIIDISGGEILNIYVKDNTNTYRNIREYINANATNISNIINGNTSVGIALKAVADGLGNNIVNTYLTQTAGATKKYVQDYALPREFNDIFYITKTGYSKDMPTDITPQFSVTTNNVGDFTLFELEKTNDSDYELSRKNSANNYIYISSSKDCLVTFRLTTQAKNIGSDWVDLDVDVSNQISMTAGQLQRVDFGGVFSYLGEKVLSLKVGDILKQTLEVVTTESAENTFNVYSNETYPSIFNINTQSQIVYNTLGKLGEQPVFNLTPYGEITSSSISLIGSDNAQIYNNVECQVNINIPISTVGYALFNEDIVINTIELGGQNIRLATPYNLLSGMPSFKDLQQVNHNQDTVTGISYSMKCFIQIDSGNNITFIVDEDNLDNYADKDYVELTAPKELFMGADGVEETNVYNFTVQDPNSFIDFRTNKTRFLLDLHLPVVGALTLNKQVAITFGDTVYYLYNILKGNEHVTIGDLKQVNKYNNATGYRFIFHATFFQNADITGFAVIPTISMSDVLSLSSDEMDTYMADGGLTDGQVALCSNLGTNNGYELGSLYKFVITYPATYTWVKMENVYIELNTTQTATQGTLTQEQFAILKANDNNGILFDHEYYKQSTKGKVEGYRTYFTIERENGETSIKTITITESTLSWVLFDTDVETRPVDETYSISEAQWQALNDNEPYTYMASVTATYTIGTKTEVGILNNSPALFATYGFVVGTVNNQTVQIFSIDKPTTNISLTVRYRG